ncbi:MAG: hypothetical protein NTX57_19440, partial [Armatimonadetes bacterium]|nr:hypothetical protein [Armatimonadota bacterium]
NAKLFAEEAESIMEDAEVITTPTEVKTGDAEKKKRSARILWNSAALQEFDVAERVANAAKNALYAGALRDREILDTAADALLALIASARTFSADAV